MKKPFPQLLLILLALTTGILKAERPARRFLELKGTIYATGLDAAGKTTYMDSAMIVVANTDTKETDTFFSAESGEYIFRLPLDNQYRISVSRDSFLTKQLEVNTYVPLFSSGSYSIEFEMNLYHTLPGIVIPFAGQPVANIVFNSRRKTFDYNHAYTDQYNRNLKKIYAAYYYHRPLPAASLKLPVIPVGSAKKKTLRKRVIRLSI